MRRPHHTPPPRWADRLLAWYCAPELKEEIQGDLHELFHKRVRRVGLWRAQVHYGVDVLRFARPYVVREGHPTYIPARGPIMLKNYLTVALRNLRKHKGYSLINIAGLALGMAACLLMLLYVQHELSYDRFAEDADQLYRIAYKPNDSFEGFAKTPFPLAPALRADFPQVTRAIQVFKASTGVATPPTVRYEDRKFSEDAFYMVDTAFVSMFNLEFIQGNPATALQDPKSILLTEETARKYFGDENPLGKTLSYQNTQPATTEFEVTGVVRSINDRSHLEFDFLVPLSYLKTADPMWAGWDGFDTAWGSTMVWTYLQIPDAAAVASLEEQFPDFIVRRYPEAMRERAGDFSLFLQPLADIHLGSHMRREIKANGSQASLYGFAAIALVILLIACINFMNLATARSAGRAREVGLRKVLGANRMHLIRQFLGEALLLSVIAVAFGALLVEGFLPLFNDLTGKTLVVRYLENEGLWAAMVGLALVVGILSGSYPAFFLSAFRPVRVLKGAVSVQGRSVSLRKALVVAQFASTIIFLVGLGVMSDQLDYIRTKELGYEADQLVVLNRPTEQLPTAAFQEALGPGPGITGVTVGAGSLPGQPAQTWTYRPEGMQGEEREQYQTLWAGREFVDVFGLEVVAGQDFSSVIATDSSRVYLLNEAAVRALGWEGTAVGRRFDYAVWRSTDTIPGRVVGVVKDFHFESLHAQIEPLVLALSPEFGNVVVRMSTDNIPASMAFLKEAWGRLVPAAPFDYTFVDEAVGQFYGQEERLSRVTTYFTVLAVLIACLGLFGLASFSAEQRTKEIGVRKVLGASTGSLVLLLSSDFVKLVLVAFVVAVPVGYFAMDRWLQDFAYRIELSVWIFLLAGLAALLIALLTVSYQSVRAALANPVEVLRYE